MNSYREAVLNALDIYSELNTELLFAKAQRLMGFPGPAYKRDNIDAIVESADFVQVDLKALPKGLDGPKLYPLIRSTIAAYKDKPDELEFFICDVIGKFSKLSAYLYPASRAMGYDDQVLAFTFIAASQNYHPADSVINEWRKYEKSFSANLSDEELEEAVKYRIKLVQSFIHSKYYNPVLVIAGDMKCVASLIDAALLENGCENDYFYYQIAGRSVLTHELDEFDIYNNSGVNQDRIHKKLFERSFYQSVEPCTLLLPALREEIAEYRCTGTWNMTRTVYIKVIADPEEFRKSNPYYFFAQYQHYIYLLNEEQETRDFTPVFHSLYEMWGEVCFFLDNNKFAPFPCKDIVKLFREQFVYHLAYTYFIYLLNRKKAWFDIYTLCPGVKKEEIEGWICDERHFMSHKEFAEHEAELPKVGERYEPFPGFYKKEIPQSEPVDMFRRTSDLDAPKEEKPALIPCDYQMLDIPRCNVKEIDDLATYYDDYDKYAQYYSMEAEDSFAKVCWDRVDNTNYTKQSNIRWARRVLQTLDATYFIAENERPLIQYSAVSLSAIMECVFMQADEPICLKRIAMESDLTIMLQESIDLKREQGRESTEAEKARFEGTYRTVGGNLSLFEKEMCDQCDFPNCPYRLLNYNRFGAFVKIPGKDDGEEEEESTPVVNPVVEEKQLSPREKFEKYLDSVCESLGEDYFITCEIGNYTWEYKGTGLMLAYLGLSLAKRCGLDRVPWSYVNRHIKNKAGMDYLKEKASRMRKGGELPLDKDVVEVAVWAIKMEE